MCPSSVVGTSSMSGFKDISPRLSPQEEVRAVQI